MIRLRTRIAALILAVTLAGCSDKRTPSYNPDIGPFDEDGNYIEAWADNPPSRKNRRSTEPPPEPAIASVPDPTPVSKPRTSPPKPKPKPVSKPKPKPKPKPQYVRHTVKKGDTLYGLSRKYGTSVSAIKTANGISGTMIRDGQSLKIPR
jgi:nucleoid-associated protein YgaU